VNDLMIPSIPSVIKSEEEGQSLLLDLERHAVSHIRVSSEALTRSILCLDAIREHSLYSYNGYDDWGSYLRDFLDQYGLSRSWAYEYLKVARLAMGGMGLSPQELLNYGIDAIKPVTNLVQDYNRVTGEIRQLVPGVEEKLNGGDEPGEKLASFVRKRIASDESSATVKNLLKAELPTEAEYGFGWVYNSEGHKVNIRWWVIYPNGKSEEGYSIREMPEHVALRLSRQGRIIM